MTKLGECEGGGWTLVLKMHHNKASIYVSNDARPVYIVKFDDTHARCLKFSLMRYGDAYFDKGSDRAKYTRGFAWKGLT